MKILHITAMSPLSPNSGIPAVLKNLTDAQNRIEGVESIVLSLKGEVESIGSQHFYYLGDKTVLSFLKEHKPNVAVIHSFFHAEYIEAARALAKERIPFYIEPHGSFGHAAMKKSGLKKTIANLTVFRQQIKGSKGYIFTNRGEKIDSIYRTPNDLLIPNGVLPEMILSSEPKTQESLEDPVFYYLGRFDIHHKGLDYLFDALEILDKKSHKIKVNIFGTGTDEQIEYINRRISALSHMVVKNCGTIYGNEKKRALEACNILLLTSRYEGSPMTILDALTYGNPCLVTPGTNVADELVENHIGWETKLDAARIADSILLAREQYIQKGLNYYSDSKRYVLDSYSWDKIAKESVDTLNNALMD